MNFKLAKKELLIPIISGVISLALGFIISSAQINKGEYLEVTSRNKKLSSSLVEVDEAITDTKDKLSASNDVIESLKSKKNDLQMHLGIDTTEDISDDYQEDNSSSAESSELNDSDIP